MKTLPPNQAPPSPSMPSGDKSLPENSARFAPLCAPSAVPLGGDLLYGADDIAAFLFGDRKHRRRVYSRIASKGLPVFRIGVNICARKSVLLAWIEKQEAGI